MNSPVLTIDEDDNGVSGVCCLDCREEVTASSWMTPRMYVLSLTCRECFAALVTYDAFTLAVIQ